MGKGGTKFVGDQIAHRGGRGNIRKEKRKLMETYLRTGYHPDAENAPEVELSAWDDGGALPHRDARRAHVYLSVDSAEGELIGNLVIELFDDVVPVAARAFRLLCMGTGAAHEGACYRGSPFHNYKKDLLVEAGAVLTRSGKADEAENREAPGTGNLLHSSGGIVSMFATGPEFSITLTHVPEIDRVRIVVGRVISGHPVIDAIHSKASDPAGAPPVIADCGVLKDGGIGAEALQAIIDARRAASAAQASSSKALLEEKPMETKARLEREAAEQGDAVKDALRDGMDQAAKRQRVLGADAAGSKGKAPAGGKGLAGGMFDMLGDAESSSSDSDGSDE